MKRILYLMVIQLTALLRPAPAQSAPSQPEQQIFDQLNQEREKIGLQKLQWNHRVAEAAREHAKALAENEKLAHQFPGEATVPERIGATGARFTLSAENVARADNVDDVHLALMNSPGHRANILNPKYNAVGIGAVEHQGKLYVTQDFVLLIRAYTETQFRDALVAASNQARESRGIRLMDARPDAFLHDAACSTDGDPLKFADKVMGATALVVFTSSEPHELPEQLMSRVVNPDFHHMNIGVCFRPEQQHGYANFWVVAAFAE